MSCYSLLASRISVEKSVVVLMRIPLYVFCFWYLIFVLCVWSLLIWLICALGGLPWLYPVCNSLGFLELSDYFLPQNGEVFKYNVLKYLLMPFLFVFFFWYSYDSNVGAFNFVLEVSESALISFNSFFLFSSPFHLFPPFYLPAHLFYLMPQLF